MKFSKEKKRKKYKFKIDGQPVGKQRPRKARGLASLYTPNKTKKYEQLVRYVSTREVQMIDKPVSVDILAVFEVPKSYSKARRLKCLSGLERPTKKPDKDNIEKIILDGMNPLYKTNKATHKKELIQPGLYTDDKLVVDGFTSKWYGEKPYVEVTVTVI